MHLLLNVKRVVKQLAQWIPKPKTKLISDKKFLFLAGRIYIGGCAFSAWWGDCVLSWKEINDKTKQRAGKMNSRSLHSK